jgi:hypothetical protein
MLAVVASIKSLLNVNWISVCAKKSLFANIAAVSWLTPIWLVLPSKIAFNHKKRPRQIALVFFYGTTRFTGWDVGRCNTGVAVASNLNTCLL